MTLGSLEGTAEGIVILETDGHTKKCKLNNVLLVPKLSYSVSKVSSKGKTTRFDKKGCEILNEKKLLSPHALAISTTWNTVFINVAGKDSTEKLWHRVNRT